MTVSLPQAPIQESGLLRWARSLTVQLSKFVKQEAVQAAQAGGGLPIGCILPFGGNVIPAGFFLCDGSLYLKEIYPALFSAIGETWNNGGEAPEQFRVPNLIDRTVIGGENVGSYIGQNDTNLSVAQLPNYNLTVTDPGHNHTFTSIPHGHQATTVPHSHTAALQSVVAQSGSGVFSAEQGQVSETTVIVNIEPANVSGTIGDKSTGIVVASGGEGATLSLIQNSGVIAWIIKAS